MHNRCRIISLVLSSVALPALLLATMAAAQTKPTAPARPAVAAATVPVVSEKDFAVTQQELIQLLRLSPTLTTVVAHDPSLLANQEYVSRNNPQLAQFLSAHIPGKPSVIVQNMSGAGSVRAANFVYRNAPVLLTALSR